MKAKIEIDMNDAAFGEDPGAEIARILRDLAQNLEGSVPKNFFDGGLVMPLRDLNGNLVGAFTASGKL